LKDSYELKTIDSRYTNEQHGFGIDLPLGWKYLEGIMGNVVQASLVTKDPNELISMGVNIQDDYDSKMTSEEYIKNVIEILKKQMIIANREEQINSIKFSHTSYEAYKTSFVTFVNDQKQIVFIYSIIKNKKGYLFIAKADEKHHADYEKLFDKTFISMKIK
jgi:hypothetical protein